MQPPRGADLVFILLIISENPKKLRKKSVRENRSYPIPFLTSHWSASEFAFKQCSSVKRFDRLDWWTKQQILNGKQLKTAICYWVTLKARSTLNFILKKRHGWKILLWMKDQWTNYVRPRHMGQFIIVQSVHSFTKCTVSWNFFNS